MSTITSPTETPPTFDVRDADVMADHADAHTAALEAAHPLPRDTVSLLDHRSRRRALPRRIAPPGHYLALTDEAGDVQVVPLEDRIVHVGRANTADLRFEDARVSRRHAILVRYGSHVRILDDRSSTGTFVNGSRVVACDLRAGDVVRLGPVAFVYEIVS